MKNKNDHPENHVAEEIKRERIKEGVLVMKAIAKAVTKK